MPMNGLQISLSQWFCEIETCITPAQAPQLKIFEPIIQISGRRKQKRRNYCQFSNEFTEVGRRWCLSDDVFVMPSDCLQSDTLPELWLKLNGATTSFAQKLKPKQIVDELKRFFFANWVVDVNCKVFPAIQFTAGKSRVVRRRIACTGRKKGSWRLIIVSELKIKSRSVRKWPEAD